MCIRFQYIVNADVDVSILWFYSEHSSCLATVILADDVSFDLETLFLRIFFLFYIFKLKNDCCCGYYLIGRPYHMICILAYVYLSVIFPSTAKLWMFSLRLLNTWRFRFVGLMVNRYRKCLCQSEVSWIWTLKTLNKSRQSFGSSIQH